MTENTGSAAALICRTSRKCPKASSAAVSRATATGKPTVERLNSTLKKLYAVLKSHTVFRDDTR